MKKILIILLATLLGAVLSAQSKEKCEWKLRLKAEKIDGVYIPKDLDDAIRTLDTSFTEEMKAFITDSLSENDYAGRFHFTDGLWLRNNWGFWRGSRLSEYFDSIGIWHPDDMSSIIMRSYYRHLKGEDIRLDEQIKYYNDFWKKHRSGFFKRMGEKIKYLWENPKVRKEFREEYNVGDTLAFFYPYGFSSKEEAELLDKEDKDAKGVLEKIKVRKGRVYVKVRLVEAWYPYGVIIFDGNIEADDEYVRGSDFDPEDKNVFYMNVGDSYWFMTKEWGDMEHWDTI